jgi:hypothetical protein
MKTRSHWAVRSATNSLKEAWEDVIGRSSCNKTLKEDQKAEQGWSTSCNEIPKYNFKASTRCHWLNGLQQNCEHRQEKRSKAEDVLQQYPKIYLQSEHTISLADRLATKFSRRQEKRSKAEYVLQRKVKTHLWSRNTMSLAERLATKVLERE